MATRQLKYSLKDVSDCRNVSNMIDSSEIDLLTTTGIEVVGFIHSGLQSLLVRADHPTLYVTRLTRVHSLQIRSDVSNFGPTVLSSLYSAWLAKEILRRVLLLPISPTAINNADSSWLETYWTQCKPIYMPTTRTSSDTSNRSSEKINSKRQIVVLVNETVLN